MPPIDDWHGFVYAPSEKIVGDRREIFTCRNVAKNMTITAYFHEETREYKLRIKIGLNELVRIEYIASKPAAFTERLQTYFSQLLADLGEENPLKPPLLTEKGLFAWDYGEILPPSLEGFSLFIAPNAPFPVANGSYIIVDYSDFAIKSNFILMYNIFRDEFFGEARIADVPIVTYDFDAVTVERLALLIKTKLAAKLREIRRSATE